MAPITNSKAKIKSLMAGHVSAGYRRTKIIIANRLHNWDSRRSPKERKWAFIFFLALGCSYCMAVLTKALFFDEHSTSAATLREPERPPVYYLPPYTPKKDSLDHSHK